MELTKNQIAWLQALESGEYKQGFMVMNRFGHMCALGVACDVSQLASWEQVHHAHLGYQSYLGCDTAPSIAVMRWLGLSKKGRREIMFQNDVKKVTFKQLAKMIRDKPSSYFKKRAAAKGDSEHQAHEYYEEYMITQERI